MIKILFVRCGSNLKTPVKVCKINDFTGKNGAYYTAAISF